MAAHLAELAALGITVRALPGDRLHAAGPMTDATRATIREHKSEILAELAANDSAPVAPPEQADELRRMVAIVAADWPAGEDTDALAAAMADPDVAIRSFRALVAERAPREVGIGPDNGMPTCRDCANLATTGRCRAAERGRSFGTGIATAATYAPGDPDRPQRCGAYAPGPNDPHPRRGRERWPFLFAG